MKSQYENRYRLFLPRRTYTIVRADGKAFHTYTRWLARPYDYQFMNAMDEVTITLCREMQGVSLAYVQSDEVSVLLTDFATPQTDAWFDGNLQKIVSVAASIATMRFNDCAASYGWPVSACFDARAFIIPDPVEIENYFVWRQKDAERNSLQMLAQHHYTHKALHGINATGLHDLIHEAGDNWDAYPGRFKRGSCAIHTETGWHITEPPIFTQDRVWLTRLIPRQWTEREGESNGK